jgi:hypothetical protein
MTQATTSWTSVTRDRIRDVQGALLTISEWARDGNATPEQTEMLLNPYREMVEALYERDIPLAKLADQSDILLHVRGPSATGPSPRVSVLTRLLTSTRDQVTRLAKQIGGVTTVRVPTSLDMGFVGVAGGSLFVGFSGSQEGDSTREAVRLISEASTLVASNGSVAELAQTIHDPAERDMALAAVRHLSPSGQIGIREIEILGKQVARQVSLTTETRRHARGIMAQRIVSTSPRSETFVGTVREVDLDASRFEIRNVEGNVEDIRCAHELEEAEVKSLVDHRVRVTGTAEYGPKGTVRLLWIDEVELLG